MDILTQVKLPKALAKANGSSLQYNMGEFGEYEQKLKSPNSMLDNMSHVKMHEMQEADEGRARIM